MLFSFLTQEEAVEMTKVVEDIIKVPPKSELEVEETIEEHREELTIE